MSYKHDPRCAGCPRCSVAAGRVLMMSPTELARYNTARDKLIQAEFAKEDAAAVPVLRHTPRRALRTKHVQKSAQANTAKRAPDYRAARKRADQRALAAVRAPRALKAKPRATTPAPVVDYSAGVRVEEDMSWIVAPLPYGDLGGALKEWSPHDPPVLPYGDLGAYGAKDTWNWDANGPPPAPLPYGELGKGVRP